MKYVLLALFAISAVGANAQDSGIKFFEGSFADAKKEAASQHKLLYIDCYTTWCGPCKDLAKNTFPKKEVGDFYNNHFVCYESDMEKGEGRDIAKTYRVEAYPTNLFLDATGVKVHMAIGSRTPVGFIELGKEALNDSLNLNGMLRRLQAGEKDTAFLKKFIYTMIDENPEKSAKALDLYWKEIPETDLYKPSNFQLFRYCEKDINSKAFQFIFAHKDEFLEKFVSQKDYSIYGDYARVSMMNDSDFLYLMAAQAIKEAAGRHDKDMFIKAREIAMMSKYDEAKYIACVNGIKYYEWTGNWTQFFADADEYLKNYGSDKFSDYNGFAWEMASNTDNKQVLDKALSYVQKSLELGKNYYNTDTYAYVLYKLKRYDDAETAAKEAIGLAKSSNQAYDSSSKLLSDIQKARDGMGKN